MLFIYSIIILDHVLKVFSCIGQQSYIVGENSSPKLRYGKARMVGNHSKLKYPQLKKSQKLLDLLTSVPMLL